MSPIADRDRTGRAEFLRRVAFIALQLFFAATAFADTGLSSGQRLELVDATGLTADGLLVTFSDDLAVLPVADPICPQADAQVIVQDDDEVFTATLPCARWARSASGFLYDDETTAAGIRQVVLSDHAIRIQAGGRLYGSGSLGGPSTFVQVELRFSGERYCGRFEAPTSTFLENSATTLVAVGPSVPCLPSAEIVCARMAAPPGDTCSVAPLGPSKLLLGEVLGPDIVYHGGQVLVDGRGTITCVGCTCAARNPFATRVRCPRGVISPGLINTHDHLTFDHNVPHADTGERYEHRHDWRQGLNGHTEIPTDPAPITMAQRRWAELRFLLGGATATAGGGTALGLLRNLDASPLYQQGLGQTPVVTDTFPLGDGPSGAQLASGCAYPSIKQASTLAGVDAYLAHVAEGVNAFARNEFACLSDASAGGQDLLQSKSTFVHGLALRPSDYAAMAQGGASLSWSPRSNIALYGDTAAVTAAARAGVRIALGTDWIVTGSMNLLRELRCADRFNQDYLGGFFGDRDLWRMVTSAAAASTATDDVIGALAGGRAADIAVFNGAARPAHRAVIAADPQDVVLVMRAGKVLYGDQTAVLTIPGAGACDALNVCGAAKRVCLGELGTTYAALQAAVGGVYPAWFCGTPVDEPTCVPSRSASVNGSTIFDGVPASGDADGDGVPDGSDDCPAVFNPVRPVDNGVQADEDGDGLGDACDPTPFP